MTHSAGMRPSNPFQYKFAGLATSTRSFFHLCLLMAQMKLKEELSRYNLAFLWWFIDPLVNLAVLYLVTVVVLGFRTEDAGVFLLSGLVIWRMIVSCVQAASTSIRANHGLSQKIYMHKSVFVVRDMFVELFKFAIAMLLLLAILFMLGATKINMPHLAFVLADTTLLCFCIAPWFAIAGAVMTDLTRITSYVFRMLFFISGIFFPLSRVPEDWRNVFLLNPMALLMQEARTALIGTGYPPDNMRLLMLAMVAAVIGIGGYFLLHNVNRKISKFIV